MFYYQFLQLHQRYLVVTDDGGALAFVGSPNGDLAEAESRGLAPLSESAAVTAAATTALRAVMTGETRNFTGHLAANGTEFQQQVWAGLRRIPYGHTCTYSELAAAIGRPTAVRAVASAVAKNPVMVVVPCHRVLPKSGGVGQFRGGVAMKRALLALEAGGTSAL